MDDIEFILKLADICDKLIRLVDYVDSNSIIQRIAIDASEELTRRIKCTLNEENIDVWSYI